MISFLNNRPVILCRSVILLLLLSFHHTYSQKVQLPFFDDFSQYTGPNPNPKLWINGGTLVNNSFAINQPSMYVATFDGRNAAGLPYDYTNQLAYGRTDTLTSQPIEIGSYQVADSLYLSFFWQAKGYGDLPDSDDTLIVSFLNNKKSWIPVWKQNGNYRSDSFKQQLIAIKNQDFLHDNFQFRFETKGRQSGPFDMWHIDYIYFNKNRNYQDIYSKDIACTKFTTSYLKRYSAMPLRQYMVNPAAETYDTLRAEMFNLQDIGNFVPYRWKIIDTVSNQVYYDAPAPFFGNLPPGITGSRQLIIPPVTQFGSTKAVLKFQLNISTTDNVQPLLPGYDLSSNDSISTYTFLDDFYAYDDGSAEIGADFDQNLGKAAIQYILSKPDSIGAVRFNFSPYFKDISGQFFLLQIMESAGGIPGKIIHEQSIKVAYGKGINGFTEYPLNRNIALKDTFYVAWTKLTSDVIAIGVDKNTPQFANRIFYNNGSEWIKNTSIKGSLMVRPVIATKAQQNSITANEEPVNGGLIAYPNPTTGILQWNLSNIKHITIFNATGVTVLSEDVTTQEINIETLPSGMYFVNFSDGKKNFLRKIMVLH